MTTTKRVRPFHCGSQFGDWELRNCDRCKKHDPDWYHTPEDPHPQCDLDEALGLAYIDDGEVTQEQGRRLGYVEGSKAYTWDCPERDTIVETEESE